MVLLQLSTSMQPILNGRSIVREVIGVYKKGMLSMIEKQMGSYPLECWEPFARLAVRCCRNEPNAHPHIAGIFFSVIASLWTEQRLDIIFRLSISCVHYRCSTAGPYIAVEIFKTIVSFTLATRISFQWVMWRKLFDMCIWWSLVPIVGGILLTSVTELSLNTFSFCATFCGCLATTKTTLAESLLHGYKFDYYMAPFATIILVALTLLIEGIGVLHWLERQDNI